jgi:hypothetical protein
MSSITTQERLQLNKLLDENNSENNTEHIRQVKHSVLIRDDIRRLDSLKTTEKELYESSIGTFTELAVTKCPFLYHHYTDIFNRVLKNEMDLAIMSRFLAVLKTIEDGTVDQHEGSVLVGRILKELYLDSAVRKADQLDKERQQEVVAKNDGKTISWSKYKSMLP